MKTYWISFCKEKNLGCCIVDAQNQDEAIKKTWALKINPGGEAMFFEMDNRIDAEDEINQWGKNRLITPEELDNDGYERLSSLDKETRIAVVNEPGVSWVCEKHNQLNL